VRDRGYRLLSMPFNPAVGSMPVYFVEVKTFWIVPKILAPSMLRNAFHPLIGPNV
jgi:hypothetical protein